MNNDQAQQDQTDSKTGLLNAVPAWGSYLYQNFLLPALSPNLTNEWLNLNSPFSTTLPQPDYFGQQWQQQQQQTIQQPSLSQQSSFDSVNMDSLPGPSNYYQQQYYTNSYIAPSLLGPQPTTYTPESQQISPSVDVIDDQIIQIKRSPSPFNSSRNSPHYSPKRKHSGKIRSNSMDSELELSHDDHEELEGVERDGMIWGMKVEDYRALSARERKRVRNRISARTFRAKRKEHLSSLESTLSNKDIQIKVANEESSKLRREVAELKRRLAKYEKPYDRPAHATHRSDYQ